MAWPSVATPSNDYIRPSSFQAVYARPTGGLYQTLGAVTDCELQFTDYEDNDSVGKNKVFAHEFTAKATMMQASLTELELLTIIGGGTCAFLFKMSDAAAIPGASAPTEGWVLVSAAQVGCKPRVVFDGEANKKAMIQLEFQGSLSRAQYQAAIKASIDDDEFEATGGSGTLKAIGVYGAAKDGGSPDVTHIVPAGIASVTIAETGGVAQTLGAVKNPKIQLEFLADEDGLRRFLPISVGVDIEYEWMQSDAANLLNLSSMTDTEVDVVITMLSGIVFTFSNKLGISLKYASVGDYSKSRTVKFMHKGQFLKTSFNGVVS